MQIELTKEQYKTLLLMSYLGAWVANANKIDDYDKDITELQHHLLKYHKDFGETELVDPKPVDGKFYETQAMDEWAYKYIEEYEDDTFWDELIDRLAERDLVRKHGEDKVKKMTIEEYHSELCKFSEVYADEFEKSGVNSLEIKINPFRLV